MNQMVTSLTLPSISLSLVTNNTSFFWKEFQNVLRAPKQRQLPDSKNLNRKEAFYLLDLSQKKQFLFLKNVNERVNGSNGKRLQSLGAQKRKNLLRKDPAKWAAENDCSFLAGNRRNFKMKSLAVKERCGKTDISREHYYQH